MSRAACAAANYSSQASASASTICGTAQKDEGRKAQEQVYSDSQYDRFTVAALKYAEDVADIIANG